MGPSDRNENDKRGQETPIDENGSWIQRLGYYWWGKVLIGLAFSGCAYYAFWYLTAFENGEIKSISLGHSAMRLYKNFGKWPMVAPLAFCGAVPLILGVRQFAVSKRKE